MIRSAASSRVCSRTKSCRLPTGQVSKRGRKHQESVTDSMEGCRNPNLKAECAQSFEYSIGTHRKAPRASTQPDFLHLLLLTNSRDSSALMCKICVRPKVCRKKAGKSSTDFFPALPHIHANQQIMNVVSKKCTNQSPQIGAIFREAE